MGFRKAFRVRISRGHSMPKFSGFLIALAVFLGLLGPCMAGENMLGRQSQNEGLQVVPAPAGMKIDGDLSKWDWSGRIWCFADESIRNRYSVELAAMWDKENLYVGAKWK